MRYDRYGRSDRPSPSPRARRVRLQRRRVSMRPLRRILASVARASRWDVSDGSQRAPSGSKRWSTKATSCRAPDRTEVSWPPLGADRLGKRPKEEPA